MNATMNATMTAPTLTLPAAILPALERLLTAHIAAEREAEDRDIAAAVTELAGRSADRNGRLFGRGRHHRGVAGGVCGARRLRVDIVGRCVRQLVRVGASARRVLRQHQAAERGAHPTRLCIRSNEDSTRVQRPSAAACDAYDESCLYRRHTRACTHTRARTRAHTCQYGVCDTCVTDNRYTLCAVR